MGWELEWYAHYPQALEELTPRLQSAVRDGKLTPRGIMTRAPLDLGQLRPWFELDAKATIAASAKSLWTDAEPELDEAPRWADALVLPAGAFVTIDDFRAWAESEGIAAPGEVAALLRDPTDAPPSVFAESQEQPDTAHSGATEKAATEVTPTDDDEQGEAAPPATEQKADDDAELAALFDPVKVATHGGHVSRWELVEVCRARGPQWAEGCCKDRPRRIQPVQRCCLVD